MICALNFCFQTFIVPLYSVCTSSEDGITIELGPFSKLFMTWKMQRRVLDSGKYLLRRLILDKSLWLTKMFTIGQTPANSSSLITIVPYSRFQECVLNIDLKCRVDVMNFVKFNEPFSHEFGLNEFNFIGFINPYFDTIWYHIVDNGRFYQKCLKIFEIGPTIL